jgi:hypothetical protein
MNTSQAIRKLLASLFIAALIVLLNWAIITNAWDNLPISDPGIFLEVLGIVFSLVWLLEPEDVEISIYAEGEKEK